MKSIYFYPRLLALVIALAACTDAGSASKAQVVKATPVTVAQSSHKQGQGKPALDISLVQPQQLIPEGQPASVDLSLRSSMPAGTVAVTLALPDTLSNSANADLQYQFTLPAGVLPLNLTLYSQVPGKHYIQLHAHHLETSEQRLFNAIVWVGEEPGSLKKSTMGVSEAPASGVQELPARESIY